MVPDALADRAARCPSCGAISGNGMLQEPGGFTASPAREPEHAAATFLRESEEPSPPPPPELRRDCEPHRGPTILALGVISLVSLAVFPPLGVPFGIIAWVMGHKDLKKIRAKQMDPAGEQNTNAGRVCGIIGTIMTISMTLMFALIYGLFFGAMFYVGAFRPPPRPASGPPTIRAPKPQTGERIPEKEIVPENP
jgi:hypothetical protein